MATLSSTAQPAGQQGLRLPRHTHTYIYASNMKEIFSEATTTAVASELSLCPQLVSHTRSQSVSVCLCVCVLVLMRKCEARVTFSLSSVICHTDKVTKLLVGFLLGGLVASDISKLGNLLAHKICPYISAQLS